MREKSHSDRQAQGEQERHILLLWIPHLRIFEELGEVASQPLWNCSPVFSVLPALPYGDFALALSLMCNQLFTLHTLPLYCLKHTQIFPI